MKKLVQFDPKNGKATVAVTFTLTDGKVVIDPPDAIERHTMLSSLVVGGKKTVKPQDGQAYYDALDGLKGTYYAIKNEE